MSKMRAVFMGEHQLRAGWRLIIFLAFVLPLGYGAGKIVDSLNAKLHAATGTPWDIGMVMGIFACAIFAATGIMARNFHGRHDAAPRLRVAHEKRRVAQAASSRRES